MSTLRFNLRLPTDGDGFVGRVCRAISCRRYFKVQGKNVPSKLICPYCGTEGALAQTHTPEQTGYARRALEEKARKYVHDEFQNMLRSAFSGSKHIRFSPGPIYIEKHVAPRYREKAVDTDLTCPECEFRFRVNGIFGYCPKCRTENAAIYDTNLEIIRREIASATDQKRALRHAYSDLVSTLEKFCKNKVGRLQSGKRASYQRLDDVEELAVAKTGKKLDGVLSPDELVALRSVFQKRHVNTHNGGIIDERFARDVPNAAALIGKPVAMSVAEFEVAALAVQKLIATLFLPPGTGPRARWMTP